MKRTLLIALIFAVLGSLSSWANVLTGSVGCGGVGFSLSNLTGGVGCSGGAPPPSCSGVIDQSAGCPLPMMGN